ncbi:hypothetical protein [Silvibacterium acidisoli]|uniref:hypothetical protein n=1 Tax=Acidobacteriaceae bacterium ZG23-2 TaxID=2883246 RepID=UPI00406BF377
MRRLFVLLLVLSAAASLHGQKTRYGQELPFPKKDVDYPLTVHVSAIHLRWNCLQGYCTRDFILNSLVAGRKREFTCSSGIPEGSHSPLPVTLGDTHGRALPKESGDEFGDDYELLTTNGRVIKCWLSGISE